MSEPVTVTLTLSAEDAAELRICAGRVRDPISAVWRLVNQVAAALPAVPPLAVAGVPAVDRRDVTPNFKKGT